jgi:hypothetical protein
MTCMCMRPVCSASGWTPWTWSSSYRATRRDRFKKRKKNVVFLRILLVIIYYRLFAFFVGKFWKIDQYWMKIFFYNSIRYFFNKKNKKCQKNWL